MKKAIILAFLALGFYACSSSTTTETTNNTEEHSSETPKPETGDPEQGKPTFDVLKYEIGAGHVGVFQIGEKVAPKTDGDTYTMRSETRTEEGEGTSLEVPISIISDYDEDLIELNYQYDLEKGEFLETISEIVILSDKLKTSHGLGIGSTITKVADAFDDSWVWHTYISGMYVIESKTKFKTVQFLLDKSGYQRSEPDVSADMEELDRESFDPNTKVTKIRVL